MGAFDTQVMDTGIHLRRRQSLCALLSVQVASSKRPVLWAHFDPRIPMMAIIYASIGDMSQIRRQVSYSTSDI